MSLTLKQLESFQKTYKSVAPLADYNRAMKSLFPTAEIFKVAREPALARLADNPAQAVFERILKQTNIVRSLDYAKSMVAKQLKLTESQHALFREQSALMQHVIPDSYRKHLDWFTSPAALTSQIEAFRTLHSSTFGDLLNSHTTATEQLLQRRYSGLNISDSIGELLAKRYGLSVDIDDVGSLIAADESLPDLPDAFQQLPIDKALEKPEVQYWFEQLSLGLKKIVSVVLIRWLLIGVVCGVGTDIVKETIRDHATSYIGDEDASRQVRKGIQNTVGSDDHWHYLKNFRTITRNNVYLRSSPSENAEIQEMLQANTPLYVMDKSNRQWLAVEVEINGEKIQGWVSRRYTLPLHRH
ncbi:SH3 domain-containing protein [Escherichia fergusonii]|uniref:SH3b domain-containing protein n=1 Tax=Escherichia fergusonii (strain ATCC 35469 / DSM 13698 / CCUG 18766 / IAM 14443 / JCM 21226 / LMG 7866 / NBRC 102419 / NCTC 12128 / CDC 0568-73) TaxID=585054 RepID=B7LP73_ESCF3|nr:SH3 domain-containing protein [Escherichia fergusonii]EIH2135345.1 SH3 domain-containing protein [Escherichia fergusonii]EIH2154890.1 SH3 domain-containing protein [Escherichia fergusonii]EIH9410958.1 SH3 domain-containing protein [Escherichia fergusonii]EIH9432987.1 SH3 domain-containing protein [Escherichia fergusonii]MBA8268875.1 SH3 domain-containing protein [Escherichia fergusonii]